MTLRSLLPAALMLIAASSSCSRSGGDAAVPKPDAWPRMEPYPEAYSRTLDGFAINDSAIVTPGDSAGWFTAAYPRYNARLYLTVTRVDPSALAHAVDNRLERMALNSGGSRSTLTELTAESGFECRLMTTLSSAPTPLQFLAVRPDGCLVSGAVVIDGAATSPPDSFAPSVAALERDIIHALKHLDVAR